MDEQRDTIAVDDAALQHLHSFMAGMRRQGAVCPVTAPRRPHGWLVTRHADVRALLGDDRVRHDPAACAEPDRTRLRCLIARTFTESGVARLRPLLVARIEDLLDEFDPNQPIDVVTQFAVPLTDFAIRELLGADELGAALMAGHDATVNLIANTILALLTSPDQLTLLNLDHELVPNTIEEVLRYESPVNILPPRRAAEPITVDGVTIPAGDVVLLSVASANRDEREFPDPDTFDITREPGRQLAFGHGVHHCPAAPLARLAARLAIAGLLGRFPNLGLVSNPAELRWRDSALMHGPAELLIRVD